MEQSLELSVVTYWKGDIQVTKYTYIYIHRKFLYKIFSAKFYKFPWTKDLCSWNLSPASDIVKKKKKKKHKIIVIRISYKKLLSQNSNVQWFNSFGFFVHWHVKLIRLFKANAILVEKSVALPFNP